MLKCSSFYISKNAIEEIRSGGEGIKKGIDAYGDFLAELLPSKAAKDALSDMGQELNAPADVQEKAQETYNEERKKGASYEEAYEAASDVYSEVSDTESVQAANKPVGRK
jgi:hypothetical protein